MTNPDPTKTLWIIRRGNGKAQVHPSPVHLLPEQAFLLKNWTEAGATIVFPPESVAEGKPITIPAGGEAIFHLLRGAPRVFEYDVTFPELRQYAEGNSKPTVIVDG